MEKLLAWKMKTFGLQINLTRTALLMVLLFTVHFTVGVLLTEDDYKNSRSITIPTTVLVCIEALMSYYILSVQIRQIYHISRLSLRSIFSYIDGVALCLSLMLFFLVVPQNAPSHTFLAFSTLLIWIATILVLRIYRPISMLLLLLTETMEGVFFVSGAAHLHYYRFVGGLKYRRFETLMQGKVYVGPLPSPAKPYNRPVGPKSFLKLPISSFPDAQFHIIGLWGPRTTRIGVCSSWNPESSVCYHHHNIVSQYLDRDTESKMKRTDKNVTNLYHLQMASLQVEVELGLLSSSERARWDWFPEWFSYSMTETEKRVWKDFVEKNPLKWAEENDFKEDKDHTSLLPIATTSQQDTSAASSNDTVATSSSTSKPHTQQSLSTTPNNSAASISESRRLEPGPEAEPEPSPSVFGGVKPTMDLDSRELIDHSNHTGQDEGQPVGPVMPLAEWLCICSRLPRRARSRLGLGSG